MATAARIAFAVRNAIGVTVRSLPLTALAEDSRVHAAKDGVTLAGGRFPIAVWRKQEVM